LQSTSIKGEVILYSFDEEWNALEYWKPVVANDDLVFVLENTNAEQLVRADSVRDEDETNDKTSKFRDNPYSLIDI
jgi:hypothetical protein